MDVVIDGAGRLVIPKELRDRLGITPGSTVTLTDAGTGVLLEPAGQHGRIVDRGKGPVVERTGVAVTDEDIRRIRDAGRR